MICHHCHSSTLIKSGKQRTGGKLLQRWSCNTCHRISIEGPYLKLKGASNV